MIITETLETGREYFWKRTEGWDWFGIQRWWEVFIRIDGFNGGGGLWIEELWRWNGSLETLQRQPRTLSLEDSQKLIAEIERGDKQP